MTMKNSEVGNKVDTIISLYRMYDDHRNSVLWFLEELEAKDYQEYLERYSGVSAGRLHFTTVCGFFELSGVLAAHGLIDPDIYFDIFNPTPFWEKGQPIIEGMRTKRPHIYENFESLNQRRITWSKSREKLEK